MRTLPPALSQALAENAMTFCHCWWLIRTDGITLGLTDHDETLAFDGKTFDPSQALKMTNRRQQTGFESATGKAEGVLSHDGISEADILAGRWDKARVETWLVSWENPELRLLLDVHDFSDIRRKDNAFVVELNGIMQRLDEVQGRRYLSTCDATLGDQRCGVNLANSAFRFSGSVQAVVDVKQIMVTLPSAPAQTLFDQGILERANGEKLRIRSHVRLDGQHRLTLFDAPAVPIVAGEALVLVMGCDRRFRTCRDVFANAANFRGFPHIPGNAFVLGSQRAGTGLVGPRE
jgi:uncharacterized phage protein (TIGR02218 family)